MSGVTRTERVLPGILADLGAGPTGDYSDLIARTARSRQRPGWTFPERWLPMDITLRPASAFAGPRRAMVLLVLLLIALLAGVALYAGSAPRVPPPFGIARNGAIAYGSGNQGDIYVQNTVGGAPHKVFAGSGGGWPSFAPDGTRILTLQRAPSAGWDLVVMRPDGTRPVAITKPSLGEPPWWWAWTPDSRSVAVVTANREDAQLRFYDAASPSEPRTVDTGLTVDAPAFRPGHPEQMLFRGLKGDKIGLYLMNVDGTGLRPLIEPFATDDPFLNEGELRNPVWSPDGERIAYQRFDPALARVEHAPDGMTLYVMDADGAGSHQIGYTPGDVLDDNPAWSPDGTRIAFQRFLGDDVWQNAVVDVATGRVTRLLPDMPGNGESLAWTPDGSGILAVPWLGDHAKILDPDGGPATNLPWGAGGADSSGVGAGAGGTMQRLAP